MKKFLPTSFFTVCFILFLTPVSHAYLDPGTSTYVIQIIAGAVIAAGTTIGIYRHKIKMFFRNRKKK